MKTHNLFFNKDGQLRSWWRSVVFAVAFLVCAELFQVIASVVAVTILGVNLRGGWALRLIIAALVLFSSATLVGWGCGAVFERLPFRSLGWWPHVGWVKNLALGSAIGAASLLLAAGLVAAARGIRFTFNESAGTSIGKSLIISAGIFVLSGAAEEALFRGYQLQTMTRAGLVWLGVIVSSVAFAISHLINPNVAPGFTLINTGVAGVWLAIAYVRTRSLWFPLGLHWAWNWTQASLLGLPVSGIQQIAPAPLLHAMNAGPDWLTGGAYGIEGGAACTFALIVSTVVIWRTKLVSKDEDQTQATAPESDRGSMPVIKSVE